MCDPTLRSHVGNWLLGHISDRGAEEQTLADTDNEYKCVLDKDVGIVSAYSVPLALAGHMHR